MHPPFAPRRMKFHALLPAALLAAAPAILSAQTPQSPGEKVTYQDHALPVFRNACLSCHNQDKKKAGLDLSTFSAAMTGSDNGPVISAGDPGSSKLYKVMTHAEEPTMPPKKDKLPDKELEVIRKWIAAGALENASGKAIIAAKPKVDLTVVTVAGKPEGPIAMPKGLVSEPFVRTQRAGATVSLATSPWAPLGAIGGQRQVLLYHTGTLELLGVLPFPEGLPQVLKFSRSGGVLLAGGGEAAKSGKVVLFDVNTGNRVTEIGDELDAVLAADISPDQSVVALGGPGRVVKGYAVADGQPLYSIKKHTDWVTAVAFSPDGQYLASADRAGGISVWEAKTGQEVFTLTGHKEAVTSLAFRDDSKLLASCSADGSAKLWNMDDGKEFKTWAAHGTYRPPQAAVGAGTFDPTVGSLSIAFAHDGRLVTTGRDKAVKVWDAAGNAAKALEPKFADIALHAAFDADGQRVIAGDLTGAVKVWNLADGKVLGELTVNPPTVAERLETALKKLAEAQPALEKVTAEFKVAQDAANKAKAEHDDALATVEAAKKTVPEAEAKAKAAADAAQAATEMLKKAQAEAQAKQQEATRLAVAAGQVELASKQSGGVDLKSLEAAVAEKQKSLDEAEKALADAKSAAEKKPDDAALKKTVEDAQARVGRRTGRLADAKKALEAAQNAQNKPAPIEAVEKAKNEADEAAEAAKAAQQSAADAAKALEKASADAKAVADALAKIKTNAETAAKSIQPKADAAKAAVDQLVKAKSAADATAAQLKDLQHGVAKLRADVVGSALAKARADLADRETKLAVLKADVDTAKAAADQAAASAATFEKGLPEAPNRLKARQQAAEQAKAAAAAAKSASDAVAEDLKQREALAQQSADLSQKLAATIAKAKENKTLADAAEKAKSTADLLAGDVSAARQAAAAKADEAKKATDAQAAAEAELAKTKNEAENGPKLLADLKKAAADAAALVPRKQAAAEAAVKPIEEAKVKVEQLKGDYDRLAREAEQLATR